jgi:hypothetical protein
MFQVLAQMGSDHGSLPTTLAVLLEQVGMTEDLPRWYLTGMDFPNQIPAIKLVKEEDFREAKLDQIVDISFKDERAEKLLQRLAGWADMELVIDPDNPSWLDKEITINMQNIKLRQAIRNIISTLGGQMFVITDENTIEIAGPIHDDEEIDDSNEHKSSESDSEGYVGKISIPMEGGKYFLEFMLREKDLTEQLKNLREQKIKEIMEKSADTES